MISIVIVSFNTRVLTRQCLRSIAVHCPDAQVIVVDNAGQDDSAAMVQYEFPNVFLIESATNLGFAGANNLGLAVCRGEFIILLNSDTVLEDDSLLRCAQWLCEHPEVGAVSPRLVGMDGHPQRCLYRFPTLRAKLFEMIRQTVNPQPEEGEGWLAGTALMIRREALSDAGGKLDDHFFMYWEDADLSMRIRKAGWQIEALGGPHIRHYGGASGGGPDASRRSDLHAWYVYGKHRWFAKNRPTWVAMGAWMLDMVEVPRKYFRGMLRPARRNERAQAVVQAIVLARMLVGLSPPRPEQRRVEAIKPVTSPFT